MVTVPAVPEPVAELVPPVEGMEQERPVASAVADSPAAVASADSPAALAAGTAAAEHTAAAPDERRYKQCSHHTNVRCSHEHLP